MKTKLLFLIALFFLISSNSSQWIEQTSGHNIRLNGVSSLNSVISPIHGWICGNNGIVITTSNGGTNWISAFSNIPPNADLTSILGMSNSYTRAITAGLLSGNTAVVYFTSNGGASWQNTFMQTGGEIYGFAELSSMYDILLIGKPVGNRWTIFRSTNEGRTWDSAGCYLPQSGNETGFVNSVFAIEGKAWFGTNNSRIYYTPSGVNWTIQSTVPDINSSVVWFQYLLTDQSVVGLGLAAGTTLSKTTNLGMNWTTVTAAGSGEITGIAGSPSSFSKSWYSRGDKIYTGIEGNSWILEYTAPSGNYTHIANNKTGSPNVWAVRDNGGISKYTGQIGIQIISNEVPEKFSLSQNYPNPFNPSTKINFSIPSVETTRRVIVLKIYDILGNEAATLVNQPLMPGTYSVDWDAANSPSGVYFYRLSAGEFTQTNKMILLN